MRHPLLLVLSLSAAACVANEKASSDASVADSGGAGRGGDGAGGNGGVLHGENRKVHFGEALVAVVRGAL